MRKKVGGWEEFDNWRWGEEAALSAPPSKPPLPPRLHPPNLHSTPTPSPMPPITLLTINGNSTGGCQPKMVTLHHHALVS